MDEAGSKRLKGDRVEEAQRGDAPREKPQAIDGKALANELEQELQCACCSALVYRPVVVMPCQHFFCGSCIVMWIRNGGSNCPACRAMSTVVSPSRALQTMVDVLLRAAPSKTRPQNERIQADEVYRAGSTLRLPSPRQASPEPNMASRNANFVHPCPHCAAGNSWGWRCPQPIVDPEMDPENAWHTEDGSPPGHAYCGNCENILALQAPPTTKCDLCQVAFCGIGVPGRCVAAPLLNQQPHGLSDLSDLIQCGEVYDCFDSNTVEVDIMLDYMTAQSLSPRHIYREIVAYIQSQPRQFAPLIELDLFMDVHGVAGGVDPDLNAPRNRICRVCATEVFLWGLRDWWVRERRKGFLADWVVKRPDCPEGSLCSRQKDHVNHIITPPEALQAMPGPAAPHVPMPEHQLALPAGSQHAEAAALPQLLPLAGANAASANGLEATYFSQMSGNVYGPDSQDFRDEVDALL
ncbi:uncharacterized protein LAESUDRAFT_733924 [Laetiporus sulphureus 93-53]|uniref:RING-type domain-containing protein n=1 Tax=Laetiporus sulphureus 93-53 TaxID=1314785 RepID=A0A165HQN3_9APHY|nr:uncharacterized protein LAESUDRAFT_733924 [Laetiporus sulphureus 93-53]KZT12057.1 hypothetical protein LAESUDRAFT_733924 [Laetiporus sulphureus 93-53]